MSSITSEWSYHLRRHSSIWSVYLWFGAITPRRRLGCRRLVWVVPGVSSTRSGIIHVSVVISPSTNMPIWVITPNHSGIIHTSVTQYGHFTKHDITQYGHFTSHASIIHHDSMVFSPNMTLLNINMVIQQIVSLNSPPSVGYTVGPWRAGHRGQQDVQGGAVQVEPRLNPG